MFKIDNVVMPTPKTLVIEHNKIWSENAGRLANGDFVGDLIAIKRKLNITWGGLSKSDAETIINALNVQYATIKYTGEDGTEESGSFYFGDVSSTVYSWCSSSAVSLSSITANAIER